MITSLSTVQLHWLWVVLLLIEGEEVKVEYSFGYTKTVKVIYGFAFIILLALNFKCGSNAGGIDWAMTIIGNSFKKNLEKIE